MGIQPSDEVVDAISKLDRAAVESFIGSLGEAVGDNAAG